MAKDIEIKIIVKDWKAPWDFLEIKKVVKGIKAPILLEQETNDYNIILFALSKYQTELWQVINEISDPILVDFALWGDKFFWDPDKGDFYIKGVKNGEYKIIYWDHGDGLNEIIEEIF